MAIPLMALAMGLGAAGTALGGWMNSRTDRSNARAQNAWQSQQQDWLRSLMQGNGPTGLENTAMSWLQGAGQGSPGMNQMFNAGQDGLMQSLRSDPGARSRSVMEGVIAGGGNPFDNTELFRSLGVLDQRNLNTAIGELRSSAPGLGQRFGTSMRNAELNTVLQSNENAAARNAGIAQQSYGDAQARLMSALGMLGQQEMAGAQLQQQGWQGLMQGGLGASQLASQNWLGQLGMQGDMLSSLLGAQGQRQGYNAQIAALASSLGGPAAVPGYGDVFSGLGSAAMFAGLMNNMNSPAAQRSPTGRQRFAPPQLAVPGNFLDLRLR